MVKIKKEPVPQDLKESNQSLTGSQSNAVGLDVSLPRGVRTFFRYRTPVKQLISSVFIILQTLVHFFVYFTKNIQELSP